jgi:glutamate-1-semialdehyde aminotransferase
VVTSVRNRGSVHYRRERPRTFREAADIDDRLQHLAWLYQTNGGVFVPENDPWTFGVAHTPEDIARVVENAEAFAAAVAG